MANVAVVLIVLLVVWFIISYLRRRGDGIVAKRGTSVGADLAALADQPRVRVRAVTKAGPDRVRLVLSPEPVSIADPGRKILSDLDLVVLLQEEEFGFKLLHEWKRSESSLAIVMPPDSRLVRLRAIDDLQPLTLHRLNEG